jgi:hypothetical protein
MEPVGSVTSASSQVFIPPPLPLRALSNNPEAYKSIAERNKELADYLASRDLLLNQIPQQPAQDISGALGSLSVLAFQALEPGQSVQNRETLQVEADNQLADLRSLLDTLNQEDLTLFTAVFTNTIPQALTNTGTVPEDTSSTLSLDVFSNQTLENLFQIDITTESGSLAALNLINSFIDSLSSINNNSNPLETLLDNLTGSLINFAAVEAPSEQAQTETSAGQTSGSSSNTGTEDLTLSTIPLGQTQETIFDLVG